MILRTASDKKFHHSMFALASVAAVILVMIFIYLLKLSWPSIEAEGLKFFVTEEWDPVKERFGAAAFIYGTLVSSLLALMMAVPLSLGVALFLNEIAPTRVSQIVGFLVEMLAAIPSVVYGLWGIYFLAPFLRLHVQPVIGKNFGWIPLFDGPPYGVGMLAAGIILSIMITPTITAICREVFKAIPSIDKEGALALGATRWEMITLSVLKSSRSGIFGAVVLGLGRALGETMAVTMLIGNKNEISFSLFAPAQTMASVIANEYAEAATQHHISALAYVGLALFLVSLVIHLGARLFIMNRVSGGKK